MTLLGRILEMAFVTLFRVLPRAVLRPSSSDPPPCRNLSIAGYRNESFVPQYPTPLSRFLALAPNGGYFICLVELSASLFALKSCCNPVNRTLFLVAIFQVMALETNRLLGNR